MKTTVKEALEDLKKRNFKNDRIVSVQWGGSDFEESQYNCWCYWSDLKRYSANEFISDFVLGQYVYLVGEYVHNGQKCIGVMWQ